ncbi:MAG: acetyl-CoA carboxylase biotin carboxyl carrier protein subunit [Firmicutes bacterium]|nr:acetyl-CoA carboxylase biotin carboxyl carrier protein subunit [Bacillota bacterium]
MKNFIVTVNGNTYDVAVEEVAAGTVPVSQAAPTPAAAPAPKTAEPKKETKSSKPSVSGGTPVKAPMPGNVFDIKVNVGDKVEENQIVVVLEAMKMENEIVTPNAGTVASIDVNKGDSVNSGDVLVTIA